MQPSDPIAVTVRFFHIAFGVAWIGAIAYAVAALRRVMPRVGPRARRATMRQLIPVVVQYVPGSAAMTILTGAILYLLIGGFDVAYMTGSRWGLSLLIALVLGLMAFAYGTVVGVGTASKILIHLEEETVRPRTRGRDPLMPLQPDPGDRPGLGPRRGLPDGPRHDARARLITAPPSSRGPPTRAHGTDGRAAP